jgi:hypothetical protein
MQFSASRVGSIALARLEQLHEASNVVASRNQPHRVGRPRFEIADFIKQKTNASYIFAACGGDMWMGKPDAVVIIHPARRYLPL